MSTEIHSSSTDAAGDESKLVVPRLLGATDELVAYSYRILDQCLTLCDAVEEVKRVRRTAAAGRQVLAGRQSQSIVESHINPIIEHLFSKFNLFLGGP